ARRRRALAEVVGQLGHEYAPRRLLAVAVRSIDASPLRTELVQTLLARRIADGITSPECVGEESVDPDFQRAARRAVRAEISRLADRATTWTDDRRLQSLASVGSAAPAALADLLMDVQESLSSRCLAALALARCDARSYWVAEDGRPSAYVRQVLDTGEPVLKLAMLYGAAAQGCHDAAFVAEISRFTREDAFDSDLIQAGLYFLYALPQSVIDRDPEPMTACLEEFLQLGHSGQVLYNASELLKRLQDPSEARKHLEIFRSDPGFHSYWMLIGLMNNLTRLDAAARVAEVRALLEPVLSSAGGEDAYPPQVRGLAAWYWRDQFSAWPDGVDRDALLELIRQSTDEVHTKNVDADNYAQRSGAEILALLADPKALPQLERLLNHHNESVRMVAAIAVGQGNYQGGRDALAKLAARDEEYAAFGAAWALKALGDPRSRPTFVRLVRCGNLVLAAPSLAALREITEVRVADFEPKTPSEWRLRAAAWQARLAE
ncbi:MAG: HEAT repeat domain-containing protein, partial [Planctomycetes bacterium]|nr:HEAT repeat domain-containing protein [Planctomycetota bacterium]